MMNISPRILEVEVATANVRCAERLLDSCRHRCAGDEDHREAFGLMVRATNQWLAALDDLVAPEANGAAA